MSYIWLLIIFPSNRKKKKKGQRPRKQSSIQALKLRNLSGGNKKKNQITKEKNGIQWFERDQSVPEAETRG